MSSTMYLINLENSMLHFIRKRKLGLIHDIIDTKHGEKMIFNQPKPFLKWAGGKTQLLDVIGQKFPYRKESSFVYIEPFVGGGAVLFWVLNNFPNLQKAVINDINTDLINTYRAISESVEKIISLLELWEKEYHSLSDKEDEKKEYYYSKRTLFNTRATEKFTQAALLIFLNRTCFNGLYRVNKSNLFNVPIGSYKKPLICNDVNLRSVSNALKKVTIITGDFEKTLEYAEKKTCFYIDPPYKPLSETSSFNSYAEKQFNDGEQIRLKQFCDKIDSYGYRWILSNSDVKGKNPEDEFFDNLYEDYQISRVLAKRRINANPSKRGQLNELLISNF